MWLASFSTANARQADSPQTRSNVYREGPQKPGRRTLSQSYTAWWRDLLDFALIAGAVYSFCIAAVTACRLFLYITPAVLVVILVFVIAGLFSRVLAGVFDRAVSYKLENDLTI